MESGEVRCMIIRAAREADARAMGQVMVDTYLAAHRSQMPDAAWAKRAEEWTPQVSADGWARTLREIASGERPQDCIYVALDDGAIVGLAMGGPANAEALPQTGAVYALYISTHHQGQGLGRRLVQAVAADLGQKGMTALQIGCLAANTPARGFYEAIGGRLVCERMFDEDGIMLPEVVYEWADIQALVAKGQPEPDERRSA
jgi:ribosomal protein S18 acetylase RimI-like enzyme